VEGISVVASEITSVRFSARSNPQPIPVGNLVSHQGSLNPLQHLQRTTHPTYLCYISLSKLAALEASMGTVYSFDATTPSPELRDCLNRLTGSLTFGRPDRHSRNAAAKRAYVSRLKEVLAVLSSSVIDFNWRTADYRPNRLYYTSASFAVDAVDGDTDIVTLHACRHSRRLALDCSLGYFSHKIGDEDGRVEGGSELASFLRRRSSLTLGTVFLLLSTASTGDIIGSPLFLELDSNLGVGV
jgi:hypothetical protein